MRGRPCFIPPHHTPSYPFLFGKGPLHGAAWAGHENRNSAEGTSERKTLGSAPLRERHFVPALRLNIQHESANRALVIVL